MAAKTPHRASRAILGLVAILCVVGLVAASCGGSDSADSTTTTDAAQGQTGNLDLIEEQTLTVCSDIPYPPFEFEKEDAPGEYTGFDVDLVDAMAEHLDLKTAWRVTVFDTILASLEAGDCDMVASAMTITDERKEQVAFTDPYFDAEQSLLVTKENEEKYATLEDLAGQ
ncbi:MAG: transporter substrate-binding domain-containing protein, partial [Acidimicrobiia bacterium]|nr:transporter substrate-binding domain-containing protein [Acidimicrobiia bacterium]